MDENSGEIHAPAGWVEALRQGQADIAAGRTVPLQPIIDELRADAMRLERELKLGQNKAQAAARR